jgi:cytoskeletal protein RodZ
MPSTGDLLRAERERRRLTVPQAADATNIKADHIRAIEAGEWSVFPAPVYVRGFVKTYARFLHLNEAEIAFQLGEEMAGRGDFEPDSGSGSLRRGPLDFVMMKLALVRWQVLFPLALGIGVLLAAWWGWKFWQRRPPTVPASELRNHLYQPRSTPSPQLLPLPALTNPPAKSSGK